MKVLEKVARQGDVDIYRVTEIPENAKPLKGKILQESETTGHHHHFKKDAPVKLFQTLDSPDKSNTITPDLGKFIQVEEDTFLYHGKGFDPQPALKGNGDHDRLALKKGSYQVVITREYDYSTGVARKVVD